MPDVQALIQDVVRRYRRRTVEKAALLLGLGGAALVLWGWRAWTVETWRPWVLSVGGALGLALLAWQAWRMWREHVGGEALALELDQRFDCAARFVTAAEFANEPNPPALYPLLLEDTQRLAATIQRRLPRLLDARTVVLALAVLLALMWPRQGVSLKQLASALPIPPRATPPQPSPKPPPAQPPTPPPGSPSSSSSSSQGPSAAPQPLPSSAPQPGCENSTGASGQQNQPSQTPQSGSSQAGKSQQAQTGTPQSQQSASAQGQAQGSAAQQASKSGASGSQTSDAKQQEGSSGAGQGTGKGQAALQQDIQQLLKDLQAELKQMQAEMNQLSDQQAPQPGTDTSAELYGESETLEQAKGAQMPVQLEVDQQQGSSKKRKGSGLGKPSGKAAAASPETVAEDVALTEQSSEEQAISRQPIPPDYQPIFDQASKHQ